MKTLIINGSPRKNGDTRALIDAFVSKLGGEVKILDAYFARISPCTDCRACRVSGRCAYDDDMRDIYDDLYDNIIIASPIYMSGLTGPLVSLASRFQAFYSAKRFYGKPALQKEKKSGLILTGGGDGSHVPAYNLASVMFRYMNARGFEKHTALSLKTDTLAAKDDIDAMCEVSRIAEFFNKAVI